VPATRPKRRTDRLDEPIRVLSSQLWLGLGALAIAALGAGVWGAFGNIPQRVTVTGVLSGASGFRLAESSAAGSITAVLAPTGSHVTAGQVLVTEATASGQATVKAPVAGTLVQSLGTPGEQVYAGTPVASISPAGPVQDAVLFVPASEAASLLPGQAVTVGGGSVSLNGKVTNVNGEPLSTTDIVNQFGTADAPGIPSGASPDLEVLVTLASSPTLADLPPFAEVDGTIVLGTERPYKTLF